MGRVRLAVALLVTTALAAACTSQPSDPSPTPTPSPTFSCTTATVNDPCTPAKAQEEKVRAQATSETRVALYGFFSEFNRVSKQGGSEAATDRMKEFAAGPFLTAYVGFAQSIKHNNQHYSGTGRVIGFETAFEEHRLSSPAGELTFNYCFDGRQNEVINSKNEVIDHGRLLAGKLYARNVDGRWKLWDSDDRAVGVCSAGY